MSGPTANCPQCGARIDFRWAGAVQTTCEHCQSILIRHDLDLERVGEVSSPPPITSAIQLGTEGSHEGRAFMVVGRIAYEWERGGWSEWHIVFNDGRSGWLSDAQDEYAVTFLVPDPGPLPAAEQAHPGTLIHHDNRVFRVTALTPARYAGVEGELPFEYWDREEVPFADAKSEDGGLATVDYSDEEPALYVGEYVDFEGLRLTGLREETEERIDGVGALNCPNCGSSVTILDSSRTVNVVCESCQSVLDARSPGLPVLQKFEGKVRSKPRIPLGSTGHWRGAEYRVLGFQIRTIRVDGTPYSWREFLLHNPEHGYRYFTEYDGHWNDVIPVKSLPSVTQKGGRPVATLHGETFKHFQQADAKTDFVLGEFPWEIRVGDKVLASDFVAPPRMLSMERTDQEETWSLSEYVQAEKIWKAFGVSGSPDKPIGVYANQPSPHAGRAGVAWGVFGVLLLAFLGLAALRTVGTSRPVLAERHLFEAGEGDNVVLLGPFTLDGRTSNLSVAFSTDVRNSWVYFDVSLLNLETGTAREFGREVSYYFGRDGGESWSEGSQRDRAFVPAVPAGEYVLRVAPEGPPPVGYTVIVTRDVPVRSFFIIAFVLLIVPALFIQIRAAAFEGMRWSESDYAPEED